MDFARHYHCRTHYCICVENIYFYEGRKHFYDGGIYLAKKVRRKNKCKVGNIYSFNLNNKDYRLIKRLVLIDDEGCHFKGDNANHSLDSRYFGAVPASHIEYVIISTFDIREWLGQYGYILDNALKAKGY